MTRKIARKFVWVMIGSMVLMMSGCGASGKSEDKTSDTTVEEADTNQESNANEDSNQNEDTSQQKMGKVTAIDGSDVTLALVEMPQGRGNFNKDNMAIPSGAPQPANGEVPADMPSMDPNASGAPADMPSMNPDANGEAPADMPSMDPSASGVPSDKGGGMKETGETMTLTIDESKLTKNSGMGQDQTTESATLSDITEGTYLVITYAEDGETVESVSIRNMNK